jgi:hypothetical protein
VSIHSCFRKLTTFLQLSCSLERRGNAITNRIWWWPNGVTRPVVRTDSRHDPCERISYVTCEYRMVSLHSYKFCRVKATILIFHGFRVGSVIAHSEYLNEFIKAIQVRTAHLGQVHGTPASQAECHVFEFRRRRWSSWLRSVVIFVPKKRPDRLWLPLSHLVTGCSWLKPFYSSWKKPPAPNGREGG